MCLNTNDRIESKIDWMLADNKYILHNVSTEAGKHTSERHRQRITNKSWTAGIQFISKTSKTSQTALRHGIGPDRSKKRAGD